MKRLGLLATVTLISFAGYAQRSYLRQMDYYSHYSDFSNNHKTRLKRYYLGVSKPFMNIDITTRYTTHGYPNYTPPLEATDATVKVVELKASKSYGVTAGSFFKLFRVGGESAIGFDISAAGEVYKFDVGPLDYGPALKDVTDQSDAMIISVPMALVYKTGGEVTLSKQNKSIFTLGCGFAPSIAMCKIIEVYNAYNTRRFAMLECGFFAGVAWKVRLTYYSGNTLLVDKKDGMLNSTSAYDQLGPIGKMSVYATGSPVVSLSLVVLPFSWDWR